MKFCRCCYFLCEEVGYHLDTEVAAIDVVAQEKEVGGHEVGPHAPEDLLETHQVAKVAVEIALKKFFIQG